MRGVKSLSSWVSSRMSAPESHLTILRPNTEAVPSDVLSVFGEMSTEETDHWANRIRFICRTLCFCLGPSNIWRFPRQIFYFGNATYVYLYILYVWIFGTSLFIFELGQSQYYSKGFAKLYNVCPIMSGIPLSMVFYCIISSILYAMLNVYSLVYMFSSFYTKMSHSICGDYLEQYDCKTNATIHNETSEYLYFFYYIIHTGDVERINWRDLGVLVFIIVLIFVLIGFAIMHYHWVQLAVCVIMILALIFTTIVSFTMEGSPEGYEKMFVPVSSNLTSITPWVYSVEQSLVTLGIGAGPLTTFWSASKLRFLSYKDCVALNGVIFVCTMFSGFIFFNAAALDAYRKNTTIDKYFTENYENLQTHTVVTEAINSLVGSLDNFTSFMFYLLLSLSCFYTLIEYIQLILLYVTSFSKVRQYSKLTVLMGTCMVFILVTIVSATKVGYNLMMSIDQIFIGTSLIFITSCEMIAMVYLFGLRNLCDDIEFVLGFVPNYYFQITWLCLPSLLLLCFMFSLYVEFSKMKTTSDKVVLIFLMVTIVLPIIGTATYKLIGATKRHKFSNLLRPSTNPSEEAEPEHEDVHRLRLPKHQ